MPFTGDVRSVTVPGCVDGLVALHERYGTLSLPDLLAPARRLAADGFPVSPTLAAASAELTPAERDLAFGAAGTAGRGPRCGCPGPARRSAPSPRTAARGSTSARRRGILAVGAGEFTAADLRAPQADWVAPLRLAVFGRTCGRCRRTPRATWRCPARGSPSGSGSRPAAEAARWAFLLVEAARQAAFDRPAVLHEHADGRELTGRARLRRAPPPWPSRRAGGSPTCTATEAPPPSARSTPSGSAYR